MYFMGQKCIGALLYLTKPKKNIVISHIIQAEELAYRPSTHIHLLTNLLKGCTIKVMEKILHVLVAIT